jgi:NAD(P)H-nitrite reductase large subunit
MERFRYLIMGGGMVAGYAVKELVKQGAAPGEVALISGETLPPYQRPPLSKEYLAGEKPVEKLQINKAGFYEDNGVVLRLQTLVEAVDLPANRLQTSEGDTVGFEKLLVATGSLVRHLAVPGGKLPGLYYLRRINDCDAIREAAAQAREVLIIGGGYIGTEMAARLAAQGLPTTLVYREQRLLESFLPPELSALYEQRFTAHGVRLVPGVEVVRCLGDEELTGCELSTGERLSADLAVVGVGVQPAVGVLNDSGLQLDNGVVTNEYLECNLEDIYAAGDVARWQDINTGSLRRVEHEDHARNSGRHVARVMMGQRAPYDYVPLFWSDVFDLSWEFWGEARGADHVILRGDLQAADFSAWWLCDDAVVGAFVTHSRQESEGAVAPEWVRARQVVNSATLADSSQELAAAAR